MIFPTTTTFICLKRGCQTIHKCLFRLQLTNYNYSHKRRTSYPRIKAVVLPLSIRVQVAHFFSKKILLDFLLENDDEILLDKSKTDVTIPPI